MDCLERLTISQIIDTYTVNAQKGKRLTIKNRSCYGLSFCKSGKITYTHNGKSYVSTPECAVIIPAHSTYELYNNEGGAFPLINFLCAGELFVDEFVTIPISNVHAYLSAYEKLRMLSLSPNHRLQMIRLLYGIFSQLDTENKNNASILTPALNYIDENFCNPDINNTMLAKCSNISEVYLRVLFLEKYATTPKQYILSMRIQRAKQLLIETQNPISDIAFQCGFSSVYHFCYTFKSRTGVTPTEYRKIGAIC